MTDDLTNWAGNLTFSTRVLHRPATVDELRQIVASSARLRVLGTGHSFSPIADSDTALVTVADLPPGINLDPERRTVTVGAGSRFGEFAPALDAAGWALHNLGSLPHISVAGAVATGTHGSGRGNANLAAAVAALDLVTASGELIHLARGDEQFDGAVVSLGALGVVTAVTLDVQPHFALEQRVYDALPLDALREHLLDVLSAAYSVSVFLTWRTPIAGQVWVKHRVDAGPWPHGRDWLGATLADGPRHPVPGMDPANATVQGGVPGPWHERLPHFRLGFTPSAGDELQTEYLLPIQQATAVFDALTGLADRIAPVLQVCELRLVAADTLWLSEAYEQDSLAVHFTWLNDLDRVAPVIAALEGALGPLGARPHWGKVFAMAPSAVATRYPRLGDARRLGQRLDPEGKFRNDFVNRYLFDVQ